MNRLSPCPSCNRHVAVHEQRCPFCAVPLDFSEASLRSLPRERLSRSAALAFGASLAGILSTASCSDGDASVASGGASTTLGGTPSTEGGRNAGGVSGASPAGGRSSAGNGGSDSSAGQGGSVGGVYGAPPGGAGAFNSAGVYGGAPPDAGGPNSGGVGGGGGAAGQAGGAGSR